ncbi:hypothetical protein OAC14_03065, partial [Candidatus Pelagibacter sp.]|nr:hypothetical protein [Candidatus Pelagibacter sp.]
MEITIFKHLLFYFLIIFSVVGYGQFFSHITNTKDISKNFGYSGLFGLFFLTIYSYLSNLILAHGLIHNSILLLLGISSFLYFLRKKIFKKKEILFIFLIFIIFYLSFLIYKTHDDFPYYHFQYSYYLTQSSSYIGIGSFNHGFKTPSSIFYLNSLFYLPSIKYYMFHMPALLVIGFTNIIFINKITKDIKINSINFLTIFSLLSILFIDIFFYRIAEHGTDRSALILIFVLLLEILSLMNFAVNSNNKIIKIYILIGLIISFKAFYFLYLLFFIPIIWYLFVEKYKFNILNTFNALYNRFFLFLSLMIFCVLMTNFLNTGCLLFPIKETCFSNLPWSFSLEKVSYMNAWYEQWSKGGAGPNFRIENASEYIEYFNWVSNWVDVYFFNKVSDFIFGLFTLILITFFVFYSNTRNKIMNYKILPVYLILILLFLEWFYNHPALRYGGFSLIAALIFLPISVAIMKNADLNRKNIKNKFYILLLIGCLIFVGRNIDRLKKEQDFYAYKPIRETYY